MLQGYLSLVKEEKVLNIYYYMIFIQGRIATYIQPSERRILHDVQ